MLKKVKETGVYFIGSIGVAILSFVISLLYTHMFTTKDYGVYSLIAALYCLVYQLFTGWMTHSILRYYPEESGKDNAKSLKNTMLFLLFAVSVIFALIMAAASLYYRTDPLLEQMCLVYIGVFPLEGLLLIFNTFIRVEGNSKQYSINTILNSVIKSVAIVTLFYLCKFTSVTVIIASIFVADIVQGTYFFIKYKWRAVINITQIQKILIHKVVKFGYPLIAVSVIFNILTYSDRYIINLFQTSSEVGLYSYGYNMGNALFYTMTNAIMLGAYPRLTKEWVLNGKKSTEEMMTGYLNMFCYLMFPATVGVIATGHRIINSLCAANYWDSSTVFIITCVSYATYGFLQYTNKAWELTKNTKMILNLNIITVVLNIALNFLLIPRFGYTVAAITTLVSFIVYIIISLILSKKIFTFRIDKKCFVKICVASIVMLVVLLVVDAHIRLGIVMLLVEILAGVITYVVTLILLKDRTTLHLLNSIETRIRK